MSVSDWIALLGLILVVVSGLAGIIWTMLNARIGMCMARIIATEAEQRTLRLDLVEKYVRHERLDGELGRVFVEVERRLSYQGRVLVEIAKKLNIAVVTEDSPG